MRVFLVSTSSGEKVQCLEFEACERKDLPGKDQRNGPSNHPQIVPQIARVSATKERSWRLEVGTTSSRSPSELPSLRETRMVDPLEVDDDNYSDKNEYNLRGESLIAKRGIKKLR